MIFKQFVALLHPFLPEKLLDKRPAFSIQNPSCDEGPRMQKRLPKLGKPPLRVVGAKNNLSHLKPKSRPCTHYTGLKGYIQRTFIQILPTKIARRSSNGLHFSMGGHIIQTFGQIGRA